MELFQRYPACESPRPCLSSLPFCTEPAMKQFSIDHRCDFCGQEIVYLLPDTPAEAFGVLFQEPTFLEVRSPHILIPSHRVPVFWYYSSYCSHPIPDLTI